MLAALARLEPALPAFAATLAEELRAAVPALSRLPRVAVHDLVLTLHLAAVEGARWGIGPTPAQLQVSDRHVARRAELGIGVVDVLAGIHLSQRRFADAVAAELGPDATAADVLAFTRFGDAWVEELRRHVLLTHRDVELELARGGAVLRRLVSGGRVDELAVQGIDPRGPLHLTRVRPRHGEAVWATEASLTGVLGRAVTGWLDGTVTAVSAAAPTGELPGHRVVTAGPLAPADLPRADALLRTALELREEPGLVRLADVAVAVAQAEQPLLGALLAAELLAGLDPTDADHVALVETVRCHLAGGGRQDRAARALHVHVNTVKHRLARFRAITGTDVQGLPAALAWAAEVWLAAARRD